MSRRAQTSRDGLAISRLPSERSVAWQLRPQQWRPVGQCRIDLDHCRQGPPVHRDQLGGVTTRRGALGNHQGDRLANIAHALCRERILLGQRHLGPLGIEHFEGRRPGPRGDRSDAGGTEIFARVDRQNAPRVARGLGVDAGDLCMGMWCGVGLVGVFFCLGLWSPPHDRVRLTWKVEICGVPARARQKAPVLETRQWLADEGLHGPALSLDHGRTPVYGSGQASSTGPGVPSRSGSNEPGSMLVRRRAHRHPAHATPC